MPNRGRPFRLDEAKKQQVCAVLRSGGSLETAARYVGCCVRTLQNAATDDPDFGDRLTRAHASLEIDQVHSLIAHSKKSWRAAAWFLERRRRGYRRHDDRRVDPEQLAAVVKLVGDAMSESIADPAERAAASARIEVLAEEWLARQVQLARDVPLKHSIDEGQTGQADAQTPGDGPSSEAGPEDGQAPSAEHNPAEAPAPHEPTQPTVPSGSTER